MNIKVIGKILLLFAYALTTHTTFGQSRIPAQPAPESSTGVLSRIEKYKAPPYPKSLYLDRETYDYRKMSKREIPPTLTDTFICDIWQRLTMNLKLTITPEQVSEANIKQAFDIYLTRNHDDIAGYRPWTHWNFIRKLTEAERDTLARETVEYIKKNGIRDVKE
ncbi:MAG: hypothetical protein AB1757_11705 [Acidobacteriota bacterium]